MARPKLSMAKEDVEYAISQYVLNNYQKLQVYGREKPESIHHVLATIQDREYIGAGKYNVFLDIHGTITDNTGVVKENEHYTASCIVVVAADEDNSPVPEITDKLILTRQIF